jgi:hypothetical protein
VVGDFIDGNAAGVGTPGRKSHQCLAQAAQVELDRVESINLRLIECHWCGAAGTFGVSAAPRTRGAVPRAPWDETLRPGADISLRRICNSTDATGRFSLSCRASWLALFHITARAASFDGRVRQVRLLRHTSNLAT